MNARALTALALALLTGCIDTATEPTRIPLRGAGLDDARAPFDGRNGAVITLERADLAFGPLYLCAGHTAGELCDEALAEWRDARVLDALTSAPAEFGAMNARTGVARSYMYDLGIVSRLTTPGMPLETEAVATLDGASVVLEGVADVEGQSVPFRVAVRVEQSDDVSQGVPVVRSGELDVFEHAILPDDETHLTVRFDPRTWLTAASFDALVEDAECSATTPLACAGSVERRCDEAGVLLESRDCADAGDVCLRGLGCVAGVDLDGSHQIGRAVRTAVASGVRPAFELE